MKSQLSYPNYPQNFTGLKKCGGIWIYCGAIWIILNKYTMLFPKLVLLQYWIITFKYTTD